MSTFTQQQFQAFRHGKGEILHVAVQEDKALGYFYNQLTAIRNVFPTARCFRADGIILLFMEDDNENGFDPKRIPFRPKSIIEVAALGEEFPLMNPPQNMVEFPMAVDSPDSDDVDLAKSILIYRGPHSLHNKTKPKVTPKSTVASSSPVFTSLPILHNFNTGDDYFGPSGPPPQAAQLAPLPNDIILDVTNNNDKMVLTSSTHLRSLLRVLPGSPIRRLDLTFDWEFGRGDLKDLVHQLASANVNVSEFKLDLKEHFEDKERSTTIRSGQGIYNPLLELFSNTRLHSIVLSNVYNLSERTSDFTAAIGSSVLSTFHFLGYISKNDQHRLANILSACPNIIDLALGTHAKKSDGMQSVLSRAIGSLTRLEYLHLYSMDTAFPGSADDDSNSKIATKNAFKGDISDNINNYSENTNKANSSSFSKLNNSSSKLWSRNSNTNGIFGNKLKTTATTTTTTTTTIAASNHTTTSNNGLNRSLDAMKLAELVHTSGDIDHTATGDMIRRSANKIKVLMLPGLSKSSSSNGASSLELTTAVSQSRSRDEGRPNYSVLQLNNPAFSRLTHLDLSVKLTESSHELLATFLPKQDLVHLGINCNSVGLLNTARLAELKSLSLRTVSEKVLKPLFGAALGRGRQCKIESMRLDSICGTIKWLPDLVTAVALTRLYLVDLGATVLTKMLKAVDLAKLEVLVIDDEEYDWTTERVLIGRLGQFRPNLVVQLGYKTSMSKRDVLNLGSRGVTKTWTALPRHRVKVDSSVQLYDEYLRSVLPARA
ncbi:MAG: hypothetical protein J3R72DRAFT_20971 [Linnemannia gamsii]|nr:MAG: hypothetical protein J3R72DRAFT_20971 [Linnemannia gamsii]